MRAWPAAALALACAGAPARPPQPLLAPGFTSERLAAERLAVLPLEELLLPAGATPLDSLAAALSHRVDAGLVTALVQTGVSGSALGPAALAPMLTALGPEALGGAAAAVATAGPDGRLPPPAAADLSALAEAVGAGLLLLPRTLLLTPAGPLRFEARLTTELVDPAAARVVWRSTVRAVPPTPPPGDAPDLAAAAMEGAADAAMRALAVRLSRLGEDPGEDAGVP